MTTTGQQAEQLACDYLIDNNLELITKNYHCRRGEIDLIMKDKETLVFVEVRYRKSDKYGSALESINLKKQQKIITTAQYYLSHKPASFSTYRFDVIAINPGSPKVEVTWIKDAFQLN